MKNYTFTDYSALTGQVTQLRSQTVMTQNKSPWIAMPGHRRSKILQLRQNAFDFQRRKNGPGYDFTVRSTDINQQPRHYTSTAMLAQFSGWSATSGTYTIPLTELQAATAKWYAKAQNFQTNLGELYATRRDTINMVANTVNRIVNAAIHVKHKNWRGVCDTLAIPYRKPTRRTRNDFPSAWLQYTYGWHPLVSDVYTIINKPFNDPSGVIDTTHHGDNTYVNNNTLSLVKNGSFSVKSRYRIKVRGKVTVSGAALAAASSYGITNPPLLVWELLPYSFVVDWFIGVGDYLQLMTGLSGCVVSEKSITYTIDSDTLATGSTKIGGKYIDVNFAAGATWHRKVRTLSFAERPFPVLKNPLSLSHFASAMSLLTTAFNRH